MTGQVTVVTIGGRYFAVSSDERTWTIMRSRFEMGRFIGTSQEVRQELMEWNNTVLSQMELPTQMNATRKATLIGAIKDLRTSISDAEGVKDELQEQYDGMSEKAQEGERGEALIEEINALEDAIGMISEGTDNLEGLLQG